MGRLTSLVLGADGDVAAEPDFVVLTLASAMLSTGVVMVSPLLSTLSGVFDVSSARIGAFIVAYTAPQILFIPLAGVLADRIGRRRVMVPGLLLFALGGGAIGLTTSYPVALALRALQGAGFGASMPLTVTLLGDLYAGQRETTAQGLRMATNFVFNVLAPLFAGVLVALSWRWPFALYLAMIPIAVASWFVLPTIEPEQRTSLRGYLASLLALVRRPAMAFVLATFGMRFVLFYGYLTYVSVLGTDSIGITAAVVGAAVSVKAVVSAVSSTQTGRLSARYGHGVVVAAGFLMGGVGVALPGLVQTTAALFAGSVLLGVGDAVYGTAQKSMVTHRAPLELRAGAVSSANLFQSVGKSAVPVAMAAIVAAAGPATAFVVLGLVGGVVGVALVVGVWVFSSPGHRATAEAG